MNLSDEDRQKIVAWAAIHPEILKVYLYGSRARGDNRTDSDIDVAIVMNQGPGDANALATWMFRHERYKKSPDLHLSQDVHLEWYEKGAGLEWVAPGVERDGVLLYTDE